MTLLFGAAACAFGLARCGATLSSRAPELRRAADEHASSRGAPELTMPAIFARLAQLLLHEFRSSPWLTGVLTLAVAYAALCAVLLWLLVATLAAEPAGERRRAVLGSESFFVSLVPRRAPPRGSPAARVADHKDT